MYGLYENKYVNKLCSFNSNMHESSCKSKKQVMVIWNWNSGELCGPWVSCFFVFFFFFFFFFASIFFRDMVLVMVLQ